MFYTSDSTWSQGEVFLRLIFVGMVLGVIYVIFSGIKPNVRKKYFTIVQDVVFCIISFVIVGIALYVLTNGKVQLYMLFGIIIGFLLSLYIFDKPLKIIINKANKLIYSLKRRLIIQKK